jgi:nucleotide-binding universal stress UspA family protein
MDIKHISTTNYIIREAAKMNNKTIIVAYDGSPSSNKALKLAADLSRAESSEIALVSVIERPSDIFTLEHLERNREQYGKQAIDTGEKQAEALGIKVKPVLLRGNPSEEIINYAHKENAYLIIVGTRGLGGLQRLMLGSVAQALVTHSDIPVVVAK